MANGFPSDVFVLDSGGVLLARFARSGKNVRIESVRHYAFAEPAFAGGPVSPTLDRPEVLSETLRRARRDAGRLERASLLVPDSWFRLNIIDLPNGSSRATPDIELVRWAVKRTLPVRPEEMRFAWTPLQKTPGGTQVLSVGILETTVAGIEAAFREAGVTVMLIEPIGLNVWNALATRATDALAERLFFRFAEGEFTTGLFRGPIPLFLRSRNLSEVRTLEQEIALSASYLKSRLEWNTPAECWVSGNRVAAATLETIESEFGAPVRSARLDDVVESGTEETSRWESELLGCTGVFTA
ncbi:MAG TPA: hypothetical protein VMS56_00800 [Thermoanaerobaculia bacterium]|nr:hypothetical protein [Thermoanaerobaculia bacterium]